MLLKLLSVSEVVVHGDLAAGLGHHHRSQQYFDEGQVSVNVGWQQSGTHTYIHTYMMSKLVQIECLIMRLEGRHDMEL